MNEKIIGVNTMEEKTMGKGNELEVCECCHHEDADKSNGNLMGEEVLCDTADLFKLFSDSTRIRILYALFENELCVCDIAGVLNMSQSSISHQLRLLKQGRLVKSRREGKSVIYSLADNHVKMIINQGIEHAEEKS